MKKLFEDWRKYEKEVLSESRQLGATISKEVTNELLKRVKRLLADGLPVTGHHAERGFIDIVLTREDFLKTKKSNIGRQTGTSRLYGLDLRGTEPGRSPTATHIRKDLHRQFKDLGDVRLRVKMASDATMHGEAFELSDARRISGEAHTASRKPPGHAGPVKINPTQPFGRPGNVEVHLTVNEQVFGRWEDAPEKRPKPTSRLGQQAQEQSGKVSHRKFRTKMIHTIMSRREGVSYGVGKQFYKPGVGSGFRHELRKIIHHEILHIRQMTKGWFVPDPETGIKRGNVGPMRSTYPLTMAEFDAFMRERISYVSRMAKSKKGVKGMHISFLDRGTERGLYTTWVDKMADAELNKIKAAEAKIAKLGPNPHPHPGPFPDEAVYEQWRVEDAKRTSPRPLHPQQQSRVMGDAEYKKFFKKESDKLLKQWLKSNFETIHRQLMGQLPEDTKLLKQALQAENIPKANPQKVVGAPLGRGEMFIKKVGAGALGVVGVGLATLDLYLRLDAVETTEEKAIATLKWARDMAIWTAVGMASVAATGSMLPGVAAGLVIAALMSGMLPNYQSLGELTGMGAGYEAMLSKDLLENKSYRLRVVLKN